MKRLKLLLSLRVALVSVIAIFGVGGVVYGFSNLTLPVPSVLSTITLDSGSVGAPALLFSADADSGIYSPSTGQTGFTINGTQVAFFSVGGLNLAGGLSPTTNNTRDIGTAALEWNEVFAEAVSSTSVTSSKMFIGREHRVGAAEMVNQDQNVLAQYATTTVTGSATLDFTDMGLRDYTSGNTPIVSITAEYNNDAVTLLQCNPHTITYTGMVVECVTIGDDLTAIVAADGSARTLHLTLIGIVP